MSEISTDILEALNETRNAINDVVIKKIQATQKRNERAYNKRHTGRMDLKIGDKVLKEIPKIANKKGRKGKVKWAGPYRVVDIKENGNAVIEKMTLPKSMDSVPVHQLKYFKSSGIHVKMHDKLIEKVTPKSPKIEQYLRPLNSQLDCAKGSPVDCSFHYDLKEWELPDLVGQTVLEKVEMDINDPLLKENNIETSDVEFQNSSTSPPLPFIPIDERTCEFTLTKMKIDTCVVYPTYKFGGHFTEGIPPQNIFRIPGDGNCLFSSFSYVCTGSIDYDREFRSFICDYIQGNGNLLDFVLEGETGAEYINRTKMRTSGTWGTHVEIFAFSQICKHDVVVYSRFGNYLRYKSNGDIATLQCIFLDNRSGCHFDVIIGV